MNKEYHNTFWNIKGINPDKRYYVLFSTWREIMSSLSITGYNSLEDALEECKLINNLYADTPLPKKVPNIHGKHSNYPRNSKRWDYDFSNGAYFWGYALIDLEEETVVKSMNEFRYGAWFLSKKNYKNVMDFYFRKPNEIPKDYEWDEGEYDGWIQYRWGDGKNAIGYVEPEPEKSERELQNVQKVKLKLWNSINEDYEHKTINYVIVERDTELPKRLPYISYFYPDFEPVLWEDGYDDNIDLGIYSDLTEELKRHKHFRENPEKYNKEAKQRLGEFFK